MEVSDRILIDLRELVEIYAAGWFDGSGQISERPADERLAGLVDLVRSRHDLASFDRQPTAPAWLRELAERSRQCEE